MKRVCAGAALLLVGVVGAFYAMNISGSRDPQAVPAIELTQSADATLKPKLATKRRPAEPAASGPSGGSDAPRAPVAPDRTRVGDADDEQDDDRDDAAAGDD